MIKSNTRETIEHNQLIIQTLVKYDVYLDGPFTTSSARAMIPIGGYIERIFAFPEAYSIIIKEMANYLKKNTTIDCLMGCDMIGVLFGSMLAYEMGLPFCAIRRDKPNHGVATHLAGTVPDEARNIALVDDWNLSWGSVKKFYEIAKQYGIKINSIVTAVESFEDDQTRQNVRDFLSENNLHFYTFCTARDLADEYLKKGMMTPELHPLVIDLLTDPSSYLMRNENIEKYLELKKNGKTFQNLPKKTILESRYEII